MFKVVVVSSIAVAIGNIDVGRISFETQYKRVNEKNEMELGTAISNEEGGNILRVV